MLGPEGANHAKQQGWKQLANVSTVSAARSANASIGDRGHMVISDGHCRDGSATASGRRSAARSLGDSVRHAVRA